MSDRSVVPPDDSDSQRAHNEMLRKVANREALTPGEMRLLVQEFALLAARPVRGVAPLVKPAIARLPSPEFEETLTRLASEVERAAAERGKHLRAIDAEFRDDR